MQVQFQSPQWGSNSKGIDAVATLDNKAFQSPQWGSNSKGTFRQDIFFFREFQSPQWGSNSKVGVFLFCRFAYFVSVPAMGK